MLYGNGRTGCSLSFKHLNLLFLLSLGEYMSNEVSLTKVEVLPWRNRVKISVIRMKRSWIKSFFLWVSRCFPMRSRCVWIWINQMHWQDNIVNYQLHFYLYRQWKGNLLPLSVMTQRTLMKFSCYWQYITSILANGKKFIAVRTFTRRDNQNSRLLAISADLFDTNCYALNAENVTSTVITERG